MRTLRGAIAFVLAILTGCTLVSTPTPGATPWPTPTPMAGPIPSATPSPTPSRTSTPSPPPTPIPTPLASFRVEGSVGSAPLVVRFVNTSTNATQFLWDFGDGITSTEVNPQHTYTRAGHHTVRLEARSFVRGESFVDAVARENIVEVHPGPLASLGLEPDNLVLEPQESVQFEVTALDEFGNSIPRMAATWSATAAGGRVDAGGRFTAATRAGFYADSVVLRGEYEGSTREVTVDVQIVPGPLARVDLQSESPSVFTGDQTLVSVAGFDGFDNGSAVTITSWTSSQGELQRDLTGFAFIAGREPGVATLGVQATDGRATREGATQIEVVQGFCETKPAKTVWEFEWFPIQAQRTLGPSLGSSRPAAGNFDFDWGHGPLPGGRRDLIRLKAATTIVVQRHGPVSFTVGGDDGFRLRLNGEEILNDWGNHGFRFQRKVRNLNPGVYALELDYYEWTGVARLSFETDADVLEWTEAVECHGGYVEAPAGRYFVFRAAGEAVPELANRFGLPLSEYDHISRVVDGPAVLPGAGALTQAPKVVVIQGIDSSSTCADATETVVQDSGPTRLQQLLRAMQVTYFKEWGVRSPIDAHDVIGFSYSDQYLGCLSGLRHSASSYPVNRQQAVGGPYRPPADVVVPNYAPTATCSGVAAAAQRLDRLIRRIRREAPDAPIVLIGHSLGGMVAAYYLAELPEEQLADIQSVITIDSPLLGDSRTPPGTLCSTTGPSWSDIHGQSAVVPAILSLADTPEARKIHSINATNIGDVVPGSYWWDAGCAGNENQTVLGIFGGLLVFLNPLAGLVGFVAGEMSGYGLDLEAGHSCAFYDPVSLSKVAALANGRAVEGFTRTGARIDSLDGIPSAIIEGSRGSMSFTFTNTGNTSWTFTITAHSRRAGGQVVEFLPRQRISAPPGESSIVTVPTTWGEPGPRDIRVRVWQGAGLQVPLADSGWLSHRTTVQSRL